MQSQNGINCGVIKSRHSEDSWKDSFKVTNNTSVCEFYFNISDINVSIGSHIKTLNPNVVPSVFPSSKINHQKINQNGDLLENVTLLLNL